MTNKKISRREAARRIGMTAGFGLLAPAVASAVAATPEQVEGPFHPIDEQHDTDIDLTLIDGHSERALGDVILVQGRVVDTEGNPIAGALVDIWQANHHGRYSHAEDPNPAPLDLNFQGWGLMHTAENGHYGFRTILPGAYPLEFLGGEGWRCRHIHFQVSHDQHTQLTTQMYFKGDPLIEQDLEVAKAPEELRHMLISDASTDDSTGLPIYQFDVVLDRAGDS